MSVRIRRVALMILALSAADVGVWAELDPRDWYRTFPGLGLHWLPVLGPYNEHLSRGVGGLYLALVLLAGYLLFARPANEDHEAGKSVGSRTARML